MKCALCKGKTKATTTTIEVRLGSHVIRGTVPATACVACDEVFVEGEDYERFERGVALAIVKAGVVTGETFRFLRKVAGFQSKVLAPKLGTTAATMSRWENGTRPVDKATWLALAMLVTDGMKPALRPAAVIAAAEHPKSLPSRLSSSALHA